MRSLAPLASAIALTACAITAGPSAPTVGERAVDVAKEPPSVTSTRAANAWADVTRSPSPGDAPSTRDASCGEPDAALAKVAAEIAAERARGLGSPDPDAVTAKMRAAGAPHVRPRVLLASGHAPLEGAAIARKLAALRHESTRCGVASAPTPHGGEVLVAVAVDALADLAPLPVRARTGEWLAFDARLHVAALAAKLVVLGPRGAPRTVPTSLDPSGRSRARFALDRPGAFLVQLVADTEGGPRPLLEARVFADVDPPSVADIEPAPGEAAGEGAADDASALARMVAAVREGESLPALARDGRLDELARAHAARMSKAGTVAHDLGNGDLRARFEEAYLDAQDIGENVARAETVALAHRALHASPSHRMNLLRADYTHVGIAAARGADGAVYVCEVFASRRRDGR